MVAVVAAMVMVMAATGWRSCDLVLEDVVQLRAAVLEAVRLVDDHNLPGMVCSGGRADSWVGGQVGGWAHVRVSACSVWVSVSVWVWKRV